MEDFSWFCVNAQNHCAALWCSVSQSIWSNSVWKSQNTQTKAPLSTSKGFKRSIFLLGLFQIIARKALRDLQILLYRQHERNVEFAEQTASFHIPRKIERTKPVCLLFKAQLFSHTSHFKRSDVPRKQRFHFSLPVTFARLISASWSNSKRHQAWLSTSLYEFVSFEEVVLFSFSPVAKNELRSVMLACICMRSRIHAGFCVASLMLWHGLLGPYRPLKRLFEMQKMRSTCRTAGYIPSYNILIIWWINAVMINNNNAQTSPVIKIQINSCFLHMAIA